MPAKPRPRIAQNDFLFCAPRGFPQHRRMAPSDRPAESPLPAPDTSPTSCAANPVSPTVAPVANQLTPEEQMERFAAELKEQDWGHQPC